MRTIANPISVHKFGGAALANADAIRAVVNILAGTSGERVVVTSALAGVTDILLNIARAAAKGDLAAAHAQADALLERHVSVAKSIDSAATSTLTYIDDSFKELHKLAENVAQARDLSAQMSDLIISRGERLAARIVVDALRVEKYPHVLLMQPNFFTPTVDLATPRRISRARKLRRKIFFPASCAPETLLLSQDLSRRVRVAQMVQLVQLSRLAAAAPTSPRP